MPRILIIYLSAIVFSTALLDATPPPYPIFGKDKPMIISGTFGEPRGLHRHTGLDFYTDNQEGWPIHSPWSGVLKEIGFEEKGLGLYVKVTHHSLNLVSTFGHLQRINRSLFDFKAYAKSDWFEILRRNPFLQNFKFKPQAKIFIRRGQTIAFSGQTGVGTPHLHLGIENKGRVQDPLRYFRGYVNKKVGLMTTRLVFYGNKSEQLRHETTHHTKYTLPFQPQYMGISVKDMYNPKNPQVPGSHLKGAILKINGKRCYQDQEFPFFYDKNFRFSMKHGYTILFSIGPCLKEKSNLVSILLQSHTLKKKLYHFRVEQNQKLKVTKIKNRLYVLPKRKRTLFLTAPKPEQGQLVYVQDEDGHLWPDFGWQYNHRRRGYAKKTSSGGYYILKKEILRPLKLSDIHQKKNQWGFSYLRIPLPRAISGYKEDFVYLKGPLKNWQKFLDVEAGVLYLSGEGLEASLVRENLQVYTRAGNLVR